MNPYPAQLTPSMLSLYVHRPPTRSASIPAGLVRLVDRIERAGLLRREPVPEDGRGAYAAITPEGEEVLRRIWRVYGQAIRELFVGPAGEHLEKLRSGLERVAEAART